MIKDITKNIQILENEQGTMSVTEFIIGYRIYIDVLDGEIHVSQDESFNKTNFGNTLDLDKLWPTLCNVYSIESDRLLMAPIREYRLNCIFFNEDCLKNKVPIYPNKGFYVTEIEPKNGIMIYQNKIKEFCEQIRLPYIDTLFYGPIDNLKSEIRYLRTLSKIATNKLSGGLVIKNDPVQLDGTGSIKRWYIKPDYSTIDLDNTESPDDMAKECVASIFGIELVKELDEQTNVKPTNKKEFATIMVNYIKEDRLGLYEEYKHRCLPALGDNPDEKFDEILKNHAINHITNFILKSNVYRLQADKPKSKRGRKPKSKE